MNILLNLLRFKNILQLSHNSAEVISSIFIYPLSNKASLIPISEILKETCDTIDK